MLETILQKNSKLKFHFTQAEPRVFDIVDVDEDTVVDHDDWYEFETAHGEKHEDGEPSPLWHRGCSRLTTKLLKITNSDTSSWIQLWQLTGGRLPGSG